MKETGPLPWMWGHCSRERTNEEALAPFLHSHVTTSVPDGSNNLETVKGFAESCGMPIASLSDLLAEPSFIRSRTYFGYVGDLFDAIARNYPNMQWWIDKEGLHFGAALDKWELLIPEYNALKDLDAHPRGVAFERFLDLMFSYFGLAPRGSFSLVGEQIDGSFQHGGMTFLVEAKWRQDKMGAAELHAFTGLVRSKSQWTRGLYVSYSGFTDVGLEAFRTGMATPIICLDGEEVEEILGRKLDLIEVLSFKMRAAGEENRAHVRLDELTRKYSGFNRRSLFEFP